MATTKKKTSSSNSGRALWLACFQMSEQTGAEGSFQVVVLAGSAKDALARSEKRVRELHAKTTLFQDGAKVYLDHVIKLAGNLSDPLLVNFVSTLSVAEKPGTSASILCGIPEQDPGMCESYGPSEKAGSKPILELPPRRQPKAGKASAKKTPAKKTPAKKKR
jgi:hypothetical protein